MGTAAQALPVIAAVGTTAAAAAVAPPVFSNVRRETLGVLSISRMGFLPRF